MNTGSIPRRQGRRLAILATAIAASLALAACAPPSAAGGGAAPSKDAWQRPSLAPDETSAGFDLDALVAAAKKEPPITIYDQTGKVVKIAEAFSAKYGIQATGVKVETSILEKVRNENASGNVIGDVVATQDVPEVYAELREGVLTNWVPGDMYDKLPATATYPFLNLFEGHVWSYNPSVYGSTCPVSNVWELTEPEWAGRVTLPDPERYPMYLIAWNQSARDHSDAFAAAYEAKYGEPLKTDESSAVHEWVKRLAKNSPIISKDSEGPSDAVGAPGQEKPAIGLLSGAKYRNNVDKGYSQAPCVGLTPFVGYTMPQSMTYASKTDSPNAAKLYIHFATSQEGMEFVMADGKASFSPDVTPTEDPHGLFKIISEGALQPYSVEYLEDDYKQISAWQDFWRSNR